MIQASWTYLKKPSLGRKMRDRQEGLPAWAIDRAWKAQERLHSRLHHLSGTRGRAVAIPAVARELACFLASAILELTELNERPTPQKGPGGKPVYRELLVPAAVPTPQHTSRVPGGYPGALYDQPLQPKSGPGQPPVPPPRSPCEGTAHREQTATEFELEGPPGPGTIEKLPGFPMWFRPTPVDGNSSRRISTVRQRKLNREYQADSSSK